MAALEFHQARLQDRWRDTYPAKAVPSELEGFNVWECVRDSRVLGHCIANSITGEIWGLSVDPGDRRQGIGRRLLTLAVEALRATGATRIWVEVPSDPVLPAYGFYRAVGWVPTGQYANDGSEILEPRAN